MPWRTDLDDLPANGHKDKLLTAQRRFYRVALLILALVAAGGIVAAGSGVVLLTRQNDQLRLAQETRSRLLSCGTQTGECYREEQGRDDRLFARIEAAFNRDRAILLDVRGTIRHNQRLLQRLVNQIGRPVRVSETFVVTMPGGQKRTVTQTVVLKPKPRHRPHPSSSPSCVPPNPHAQHWCDHH